MDTLTPAAAPDPSPEAGRAGRHAAAKAYRMLLHSILTSLPIPLFAKDCEGRYTLFNAAFTQFFEMDTDKLLGKLASETWTLEDSQTYRSRDADLMEHGGTQVYDHILTMPSGEKRAVIFTKACLHDPDGKVCGIVGTLMDATDRRRHEDHALQAQKLESLATLAAAIAHDFNNLLMIVVGHADMIMLNVPQGSPAYKDAEAIIATSRRAADICGQMLACSGKGEFSVEKIDAGEVLRSAAEEYRAACPPGIMLRVSGPSTPAVINADALQLRQILLNLMVNAAEAIGERGGQIQLTWGVQWCGKAILDNVELGRERSEGPYAFLCVEDNGGGIDDEARKKIFDPFFSTKANGRGLGLAAVMGIVRAHNGMIKVRTEPGRGTAFTIYLPADREAHPALPAGGAEPNAADVTVMLVDDQPEVLAIGERMLRKIGFKVVVADSGPKAIEIFAKNPSGISCVLLDLSMPEMDGVLVLQELRRIDPKARVVLSSGTDSQSAFARCRDDKPTGFVQKPYRMRDLAVAVQQALA